MRTILCFLVGFMAFLPYTNSFAQTVTKEYSNGDKYVGEFKDGLRNGQGTYTWTDGGKYVGEWKDDKRNGKGTQTYTNGEKYVGEWKDDKRNGQGTYTWTDGDKYEGEWKDDTQNGQGTYTWRNGDKYVGEYKDGKRYNGQYLSANGNVLRNYKNGSFEEILQQAKETHGDSNYSSNSSNTYASTSQSSTSSNYDHIDIKFPYTIEDPFPMGKRVTVINENGSVTQYSETRCVSCNSGVPGQAAPMGMCQICKGARGRWLYGGIWNDCTYCFDGAIGQSTGMCPNCKGSGYQRTYYYKDRYGMDYGVDMNGKIWFPNDMKYKTKVEKVGEKIWEPVKFGLDEPQKWCEKCKKYSGSHVHVPIYNINHHAQ